MIIRIMMTNFIASELASRVSQLGITRLTTSNRVAFTYFFKWHMYILRPSLQTVNKLKHKIYTTCVCYALLFQLWPLCVRHFEIHTTETAHIFEAT